MFVAVMGDGPLLHLPFAGSIAPTILRLEQFLLVSTFYHTRNKIKASNEPSISEEWKTYKIRIYYSPKAKFSSVVSLLVCPPDR